MLSKLSSLKVLLKIQSISIDSSMDRLHYRVTVIVLFAFSTLVTSGKFFGEPINCDFPDYPEHSLNAYCYIHSTFLNEKSLADAGNGTFQTHPRNPGQTEEDQKTYYGYYQWVFIVLFLQAVSYYIPRLVWESWEGGRIQMLVGGLADAVRSKYCIQENTKPLVDYFSMHLHSHNCYAFKYFFCELLYLANTVIQISPLSRGGSLQIAERPNTLDLTKGLTCRLCKRPQELPSEVASDVSVIISLGFTLPLDQSRGLSGVYQYYLISCNRSCPANANRHRKRGKCGGRSFTFVHIVPIHLSLDTLE